MGNEPYSMLNKCKYLGREIRHTCCKLKSPHECERLESTVIPLNNCIDCRFYCNIDDKDTDVSLEARLHRILDQVAPNETYRTGGGDGIIYVGEGKYWPGIVVGIHLLRRSGCDLPIEVWYRGKSGTVNPADVEAFDKVKFIDLDEVSRQYGDNLIPQGNPRKGGWEAKLYAAMHTQFDRYLFLDADAYCVANPVGLFDLLDRASFVYWGDIPTQNRSIKWKEVYPAGQGVNIPSVQGGQLLVDRCTGWKLIHLTHYICQNSHYYFRYMYGDQDAWLVALAVLKGEGYHYLGPATWRHPAFICSYDKVDYIVHRCQGKLFRIQDIPQGRIKYSNPQYYLPREEEVFNIFAQLLNKENPQARQVFGDVYSRRLWGTGSGRGSEKREGKPYVDMVNYLIQRYGWETVVDCGSGDGYLASQLKCKNYIGYDCSSEMVQECRKKFPFCTFVHLDIYKDCDIIQSGDVLLCKDVLHHWPNEWVVNWLTELTKSNRWKAIILTQDRGQLSDGQDCHLGGYRALDYDRPPLNGFRLQRIAGIYHKDMLMWVSDG